MSRFKVHPAIGVARVGNSPDGFFIGPEQPGIPANWGNGQFNSFRDALGRVKRQAARFRVFEYPTDGSRPNEVVRDGRRVVDIEWRVHLANKKASFFTFNGQSGAETDPPFAARALRPADHVEKPCRGVGQPERRNRRNSAVIDRRSLEIDPGERLICAAHPGPVVLTNPNSKIAFIKDLGELRLDPAGRLLVLGGRGVSGSTEHPPRRLEEYANNDSWFDDLGDGSVKARIRFADGSFVDSEAAWVLVAGPKFVPSLAHVVTLYDTLWDLALRRLEETPDNPIFQIPPLNEWVTQKRVWKRNRGESLAGYRPSFTRDIYPILKRATGVRELHDPGGLGRTYHVLLENYELLARADLNHEPDEARALRQALFAGWLRNPRSKTVNWKGMPRAHGDDYDALDDFENKRAREPLPTSFLSLTQIQYALIEQWANGQFISDWPGAQPAFPVPGEITPVGLDRAALENCVGAPFVPGVEVSWLVRRPELYAEPFRLRIPPAPEKESNGSDWLKLGPLEFGPGFFSQQLALPWQADFYDCHREQHTNDDGAPMWLMWWAAQRPDDTYAPGASRQQRWVRAFDSASTAPDPDAYENLARFDQMQRRWAELRFIVRAPSGAGHELEEEP